MVIDWDNLYWQEEEGWHAKSMQTRYSIYCPAGTQFRSSLDQHLGLRLSESDYEFLADKYDQTRDWRMVGGTGISSVPRPWPITHSMEVMKS